MNRFYLGLDLSSSVCGWCLLKKDGSFHEIGYIDLKKEEDLYDKMKKVYHFIESLQYKNVDLEDVFIEEPVMAFSTSTAYVISLLQRFNGMVSGMIYKYSGLKPKLISSSHARKLNGIKIVRGQNTKLQVFEHIKKQKVIPESVWEYKKTGNPKDYCLDMSDAYVVAIAGFREVSSKKT